MSNLSHDLVFKLHNTASITSIIALNTLAKSLTDTHILLLSYGFHSN
jgi:hypothetical protein